MLQNIHKQMQSAIIATPVTKILISSIVIAFGFLRFPLG